MADQETHQPTTGQTASPTRYTVPPGVASQITLKTPPGAICTLHPEGDSDPAHSLTLHADQDGILCFHVNPSFLSDVAAKIVIDCVADGKVTSFPLELHTGSQPRAAMPTPPPAPPPTNTHIRPALSEQEALQLSDAELSQRGYPLRPNPKEAPQAFELWQRRVTVPATEIEPQTTARLDIRHGWTKVVYKHEAPTTPAAPTIQGSSNNWSGFELRGTGPYDWVTGVWKIPNITGKSNAMTYSSFWVGIDGDGTTDLVQAGTEQQNFSFLGISFSSYYAWTQFLPQQPTEHQITNFPIHPSDEILVEVFIANADGKPNLTGSFGHFRVENLTTAHFTTLSTPRGNTIVGGSEAVWVMERPTVNGKFSDLANYRSATMSNACARHATHQTFLPYQSDTNAQITMVNGNNTLSTVTPADAYSMRFSWQAFR